MKFVKSKEASWHESHVEDWKLNNVRDIREAQKQHVIKRVLQRYKIELKPEELDRYQEGIKKGLATLVGEDLGDNEHGPTKLYRVKYGWRDLYFVCNAKGLIKTAIARIDVLKRYPTEEVIARATRTRD